MLQITISNNIRMRDTSIPLRAAVTKALTTENPAYTEAKEKNRGRNIYGLEQYLQLYTYEAGDLIAPRGFATQLQEILRTQGTNPDKVITWDQNEGRQVDFGPWNPEYEPRDYQLPAIAAAVEKAGVLISPAGSGKTLMAWKTAHTWGVPTLWLTHTVELLKQSAEAARKFMPGIGRVGIIGDDRLEWGDGKVFVATVQTLAKNPTLVSTLNSLVGAVIIDEAHHFPAIQFIETAGKFNSKYFLGVTATPKRKDFLEFYMYQGIGPACYEVERQEIHDAGNLILPEVKFIYTDYVRPVNEFAENSIDAGGEDVHYTELIQELTADEKRAKLVAEKILESCIDAAPQGGAVIVLGDTIRYLYTLRDLVAKFAPARLGGHTPRLAVVHGSLSRFIWREVSTINKALEAVESGRAVEWRNKGERIQVQIEQYTEEEIAAWQVTSAQRKAIMEAAYARQVDILFATGALAREGLDMPHLSRGHLVTPARGDARTSANGASVEQAIGRIQRPDPKNPNKKAVWYDYVDFEVGIFRDQYYSRRKVYNRMGIKLAVKKKTPKDMDIEFLLSGRAFGGGLPL